MLFGIEVNGKLLAWACRSHVTRSICCFVRAGLVYSSCLMWACRSHVTRPICCYVRDGFAYSYCLVWACRSEGLHKQAEASSSNS